MSETLTWEEYTRVGLRVGTVVRVEPFPEARRPAYRVWVDLGELGVKKSSAQVTELYTPDELVGTQVICVTGFPPKQIGPMMSEVLITGFHTEAGVVLARPERPVPDGARLV